MRVKLESCEEGVFLPIPDAVLEALGWEVGDELLIDVPMVGEGVITIEKKKKEKPDGA